MHSLVDSVRAYCEEQCSHVVPHVAKILQHIHPEIVKALAASCGTDGCASAPFVATYVCSAEVATCLATALPRSQELASCLTIVGGTLGKHGGTHVDCSSPILLEIAVVGLFFLISAHALHSFFTDKKGTKKASTPS